MEMNSSTPRWLTGLWILLAISLPCLKFFPLDLLYPQDWENQLWMFAYQASHIAHTGWPAHVYNYHDAVGLGTPQFYGTLIYPFGGLLSLLFGPALTLRLMIFGAFALEYVSLLRLGRAFNWSYYQRHTLAVIMVWAVYPLLNIYSRGAIAEFWASVFLIASLSSFLRVLILPPSPPHHYDRYAWGFFYLLTCSTHPLTGMMGGMLLVVVTLIGIWSIPRPNRLSLIYHGLIVTLFWLIAQASWLWLLLNFGHKLGVMMSENTTDYFGFFAKLNSLGKDILSPLWPLTFATPNIPLAIVFGGRIATALLFYLLGWILLTWAIRPTTPWPWVGRGLFLFGLIFAGISYSIVTLPAVAVFLSPWVGFMQFNYRFLSYVNLGLLFALMGWSLRVVKLDARREQALAIWMGACVLLAFISLASKLYDVHPTLDSGSRWITWDQANVHGPVESYYGLFDYIIIKDLPVFDVPATVNTLSFETNSQNPDIATADITVPEAAIIPTQVLPFPWNQIWVNGNLPDPRQLGIYQQVNEPHLIYYALALKGTNHLEYRFSPPNAWLVWRDLSFFLAALWGLLVFVAGIRDYSAYTSSKNLEQT